jgi:hypothetical protein
MALGLRNRFALSVAAALLGSWCLGCIVQQNLGASSDGGTGPSSDGGLDARSDAVSNPDARPNPETGPPSDGGTASTHTIVLYGGDEPDALGSDTWTWDGTKWTELTVTGPGSLGEASGAALDGNVVIFGGEGDTASGYSGDTWLWNGLSWKEVSTTGPSPRTSAAMATLDGKTLLFGADDGSPTPPTPADTWLWNGSTWTQQNVLGPINGMGQVAVTLNGSLLLIGGGGIYTWDGSNWNSGQLYPGGPNASDGASVATLGGNIVYFGGYQSDCFATLAQTWTFDGMNWTLRSVPGPSARAFAGMATLGDRVVLFGGETLSGELEPPLDYMNDTWTWDGEGWTKLDVTGPSARAPAAMVAY